MCGRYLFSEDIKDPKMAALIDIMERRYPGRYKTGEIFPGDCAPAIIERHGYIVPVPAVFGFPGFKDGALLINARSETVGEKAAFAEGIRERRMIIPASGFFEWSPDSLKTKYLFTVCSRPTLYLCGIYRIIDGKYRFVILTREANASMSETHGRMPVIAQESVVRTYLTDYEAAMKIAAGEAPELTREKA